MARADDLLAAALKALPPKPDDNADRSKKAGYSLAVSTAVASAFAEELRERGLDGTKPAAPGESGASGAERRMAGGIGAKKVDVTWSTEESGLVFSISIKTVNFRDGKTKNFQKNLTNRRGDMLFEGVTLHRRFPYAVLAGFFFLDKGAEHDGTKKRKATFLNAHSRLRLFSGRDDPAGRDEQFERMYLVLLDANKFAPTARFYAVGDALNELTLDGIFDDLMRLVADRNSDFYEFDGGNIRDAD